MSSKFVLVHLSDIHANSSSHYSLHRIQKVSAAVLGSDQPIPTAIAITGDIAYGGTSSEYSAIFPHLQKLASDINPNFPPAWLLVPGNHDGEFKTSSAARNITIEGLLRISDPTIDDSIIDLCTEPEKHYFEFAKQFISVGKIIHQDKLLTIHQLSIDAKTVQFWAFNVSWTSMVPEQQGKIFFPVKKYGNFTRESVDYRIALLHHPLNWYSQSTYHPFRDFLLGNFCVVLSGHEHMTGNQQVLVNNQEGPGTQMISAGAFAPHKQDDRSEFQVLEFDFDNRSLDRRIYLWNEKDDVFTEEYSSRMSYPMPLRSTRQYELRDEIKEKLEDLGAPFFHPVVDKLRLSDVFIDPLLHQLSPTGDDENVTGLSLIKSGTVGRKIIFGDDYAGKTSYLNRAFFKALDMGYIPLIVTAKDISSGSAQDREKSIRARLRVFYGETAAESYFQLPKEKRLLFVDDLDRLSAREDAYVRALEYLNSHTANYVVTVSERFDVSVIGSAKVSALVAELDEYHFLGFSYVLRGSLIERWYSLDTTLETNKFNRKVHDAQAHIDAAIGKGLIPSTPFNTLLILQALETTQKSQVVDSNIAQHYDSLLRRRLTESGAGPKHIDGLYAYLSRLAWAMKKSGSSEIDKTDLERFSSEFSVEVNPVNHMEVLNQLLQARILESSDASFRFKYPSSRYFFLAHYIAESIEDDTSLKALVEKACRHLYVRENANLVVFLTSKIATKWIVREVASVMSTLLPGLIPMDVVASSKKLNGWVTETAKLAVQDNEGDKLKNRTEYRAQQDRADAEAGNHDDLEEVDDISELDTFAQMNLVFKTGEILGLILKGRYGSLDAELKKSIAKELFDGPLRATSLFLEIVNHSPDSIIESLVKNWQEKNKTASRYQLVELAKKFIFNAVGQYSLALLSRQGSIIGSPELSHVYRDIVEKSSSADDATNSGKYLTYKLVEVAGKLSYPGEIPFAEVERLAKEFKSNAFAFNLLQGLVAQHLYMFPIKFDNKQRLAKAVEIDLQRQVAHDALKNDEKTTRKFQARNPQSLIQRLSKSFMVQNKELLDRVTATSKDKKHND